MGIDNDRVGFFQNVQEGRADGFEDDVPVMEAEVEVVGVPYFHDAYLPEHLVAARAIAQQKPPVLHVLGWRLALIAVVLIHRGWEWFPAVFSFYDTSHDGEDHALADAMRFMIPTLLIAGCLFSVGVLRLVYRFPWLVWVIIAVDAFMVILRPMSMGTWVGYSFTLLQMAAFQLTHAVCIKALVLPPKLWRPLRVPPVWSTFMDYFITILVLASVWEFFGNKLFYTWGIYGYLLGMLGTTMVVFVIAAVVCLIHVGVGAHVRGRQARLQAQEMFAVGVPV